MTGEKRQGHVLLVEDDSILARQMKRRLEASGWQVEAVCDGAGAIERSRSAQHDIVLLDMNLPSVSGLEVLRAIKADPNAPPVVIMSGYLDVQIALDALRGGAAEVLEKPVAPARLLELIDELAQQHDREGSPGHSALDELVGHSQAMRVLREQIASVAQYPHLPVLIVGETGTGKELVARAIHRLSDSTNNMMALNCAALPGELFESEVFGHESGAFTGAKGSRIGLLEAAGDGTVFLDEVAEMPASQQAKLLRALETRTIRRVGANKTVPLQARIVSATNRVLRGRPDEPLRSDLFFRLAGHTLHTTPLRERLDDVEPLAAHFLAKFASRYPTAPAELSPRAIEALQSHDWPGNVRELRAVVESAAIRRTPTGVIGVGQVVEALRDRGCIDSASCPANPSRRPTTNTNLPAVEREMVACVYAECQGNLSKAARQLQIPRSTLRDKLKRYGLR